MRFWHKASFGIYPVLAYSQDMQSNQHEQLAMALTRARRHCGLTQAEAASALGKTQSFLSRIENGTRRLEVIELLRLCEVFAADPCEVIAQVGGE